MGFLQIEKHSRKIPWRYLASFFAVLVILFGIGLYEIGRVFILQSESPTRAIADTLQDVSTAYGGDITFDPPAPVIPEPPKLPVAIGDLPEISDFSAEAILVKDVETGTILYEKNAYDTRPIASLTKLMSAIVLLERDPNWATSTQVITDDLIDTHMYAGDTYTLGDLWNAGLIASSNKAIMTLADAVGWNRPAFIARMNQKATELGMGDTIFLEPTGLNEANISTASDMSILLQEALQHDDIKEALNTPEYELYSAERKKDHHMWNTNWLLLGWIPNKIASIIGGKTGYITASGYNFMMQAEDDAAHRLSVVVLGADSHEARFTEARDVAEEIFSAYIWPDQEGYEKATAQ